MRPVPRGATFVRRGRRLPGFCVLASGNLKLALALPDHGERVLALIGEAASFAEASALRRHGSPYDVVALTDAWVLVLPVSAIESLVAAAPRFARNLIELLADRTLEVQAELESGLLHRAPQRLANYLCSLAVGPGETATLPVSKSLLAAILGMKKETLSRLLRELSERGLIAVANREVTVLDRQRLRAVT